MLIEKAKTKYEKFYNLLSDVEDESNITPSDEKLSEPINIIKSSSDIEINCTNIPFWFPPRGASSGEPIIFEGA
jgi:hypothetical protein